MKKPINFRESRHKKLPINGENSAEYQTIYRKVQRVGVTLRPCVATFHDFCELILVFIGKLLPVIEWSTAAVFILDDQRSAALRLGLIGRTVGA